MVGKYYRKELKHVSAGSPRPSCPLCKKFLSKDNRSIGVCNECVKLALDPKHLDMAIRYFNDPKYLARLLITKEILEGVVNYEKGK